jgi:MFS family permease
LAAALAQLAATRVPARRAAIVGDIGMAVSLVLTIPVLLSHQWPLVFVAAALLGATFGLGFGGSLRHLSDVVPAGRRGETMSAFYLAAYTAMAVPTLLAGWAATTWELVVVFPWFAVVVATACLGAAVAGIRSARHATSDT